ncbi:acyl carrier protein [Lutimonas vermicola]|uniref:Acyl carrier protein n=1 Tax=Lutimonas vermicola TaxID=414288 RepID=A0ABU9L704_9FLAO
MNAIDITKLEEEIKNYIIEASLEDIDIIDKITPIFETGLLDSMGLLFLIEFLTENYQVEVNDDDIIPENFESIQSIVVFVERKLNVNKAVR